MKNLNASLLNDKLGIELFNIYDTTSNVLNKFTKKQIYALCIDDLINDKGQATPRLEKFIKEILNQRGE